MTDACAAAERARLLAGALAARLPAAARAAVAPLDPDDGALLDAERELAARAVPRRRRELATGRRLARALLAELGRDGGAPLPRAPDRAPLWPAGATGSIAHAGELCAVVVALAPPVTALGLDLERARPLEPSVAASVLGPRERAALAADDLDPLRAFCAKEAVWKRLAARARRMLDFVEVEVELASARDAFTARVLAADALAPGAPRALDGRLVEAGGYVAALTLEVEGGVVASQKRPSSYM